MTHANRLASLAGAVKIRGYVVDPRKVESGLRRHPSVHEAAVLPSGEADDRYLVAFVVLNKSVPIRELRNFTETELPDYMVPGHFVITDEIPEDIHGNRDLAHLRTLVREHQKRRAGYVPPRTDSESVIARMWEDLLGIEGVGRDDDFFALGGHSLLAFRVESRIRRDIHVAIDYKTVIKNSRLSDLAAAVDGLRGTP